MVCILCGATTQVFNSRPQKRLNQVWRRRRCTSCAAVFSTEESAQYSAAWMVSTRPSSLEPFSRDKLFVSIYNSCQHRASPVGDARALADTVTQKLATYAHHGVVEAKSIAQIIQVAMNRFDKAASVHYQAFHR